MANRLNRTDALGILSRCGIELGTDYHALPSKAVDALLVEADKRKYRKPDNANGSRARYFHAYVVRSCTPSADDIHQDLEAALGRETR